MDALMKPCFGKFRHPTRDMADAHIAQLKETSREHKARLKLLMPYRCGNHWHVGHYRPTLKRRALYG